MTDICKINMDDSLETENIFGVEDGCDDGKKHRFMSSQRFASFSDAVFATVTTFMVCICLFIFSFVGQYWYNIFIYK